MRKSLTLLTIALVLIMAQGVTTSYAQRLIKKLYDDKETVRGSTGPTIIKKVTSGEREHEYYYKEKSGRIPNSGICFIQYYHAPEKVTLIVSGKATADMILAGIDRDNLIFAENFYWEVYDKFIFRKRVLRYKIVGHRKSDGMPKIKLYAGKLDLNHWILKYCRVTYIPRSKRGFAKWHLHPNAKRRRLLSVSSKQWESYRDLGGQYQVWLHREGAAFMPKSRKAKAIK